MFAEQEAWYAKMTAKPRVHRVRFHRETIVHYVREGGGEVTLCGREREPGLPFRGVRPSSGLTTCQSCHAAASAALFVIAEPSP
jgi:hypothetical protein